MTDFSHLFLSDYSVYLCVCICVYMHMGMHTCVGQMSMSGTFSVTPLPYFFDIRSLNKYVSH